MYRLRNYQWEIDTVNMSLIVLITLQLKFIGFSSGINIINTRECRSTYEGRFLYHDTKLSYDDAIDYCDDKHGKLATPTEESWNDALSYMREKHTTSKHLHEGNWIGVIVEKNKNSEIVAFDFPHGVVADEQWSLLHINSTNALNRMVVGEKQCVAYYPPSLGQQNWHFDIQSCYRNGVNPMERAVCVCVSGRSTAKTILERDSIKHNEAHSVDNESTTTGSKLTPQGRAGQFEIYPDNKGSDDTDNPAKSTSKTLAVLLALLGTCCMLTTAYFVTKKRGWNVRLMLSRMSNNPAPNSSLAAEGNYLHEHVLLEEQTTSQRPIHVYEEIILRNTDYATQSGSRIADFSVPSQILRETTMPHLPPPELPPDSFRCSKSSDNKRKSSEGEYLQPSFYRSDTISGDVRSPPPTDMSVFKFPISSLSVTNNFPGQKELKYASVETVQTYFDDERGNDEEYYCDSSNGIELPLDNHIDHGYLKPVCSRNINIHLENLDSTSNTNECTNAYENECISAAVTKNDSIKTKRKEALQQSENSSRCPMLDEPVVYSKFIYSSDEVLYSKVNKTTQEKKTDQHHPRLSKSLEIIID